MDSIFKTALAVFVIVAIAIGGTSIATVEQDVAIAVDYFDDMADLIAESNYSQTVINECIAEATANGYILKVDVIGSTQPGMKRYAKAEFTYYYKIPLFGINEAKVKHKII